MILFACLLSLHGSAQQFRIEPVGGPVLYEWMDNPLSVKGEVLPGQMLVVASPGIIVKKNGQWTFTVSGSKNYSFTTVRAGIRTKSGVRWLLSKQIPIHPHPDPSVLLAGKPGGTISKTAILLKNRLLIPDPGQVCLTDNPRRAGVVSYRIRIVRKDSVWFTREIDGAEVTAEVRNRIREQDSAGDDIVIDQIIVLLYQQERRAVPGKLLFRIEE